MVGPALKIVGLKGAILWTVESIVYRIVIW
jgi:hypothetical protein